MLSVLAVGNALIDAFLSLHDAKLHCHLLEKECEVAFKLGEKIPLDTCDFLLGGNATNVAVGIKRLGFESGLVAEIGDDGFAFQIKKQLEKEQIDISRVIETQTNSSFAIGVSFENDRILFVEHTKRTHDFVFEELQTEWVYLTSVGHEWHEAYAKTLQFCKDTGAKLALSPGTLQLEEGVEPLRDTLANASILFLNKQEAEKLSGLSDSPIDTVIRASLALGPKQVVITDGQQGSYATDIGGTIYALSILDRPVVEKTGAGDAYASGFLASVMMGSEVTTAMKWGTVNASGVICKVGAEAGLMKREELEQILRENKDLIAKKL